MNSDDCLWFPNANHFVEWIGITMNYLEVFRFYNDYIINNITKVIENFKNECRFVEFDDYDDIDNKLIY